MNPVPEDFDALLKLMALKRHEQPPPGYFDRLPNRIMSRIECGEGEPSFWEKFQGQFIFRPAFAVGFAMAALSALTVSVFYSVRTQPLGFAQAPKNGWRSAAPEEAMTAGYNLSQPLHVASWIGNESASNPAPSLPSLFAPGAQYRPLPVSFASPP
ncbi:MAG TPA: hypothetical protein VGO59_09200 [Verrucomicrobiae bacterium]|jgi:hypothetical protein